MTLPPISTKPALPVLAGGDVQLPADQHPVAVYFARLAPGSRRVMAQALEVVADIATGGREGVATLAWHQLRYQHTQTIRAQLIERYKPAAANKVLAALRGVLKEAWRLGQMTAEEYHRAADLPGVKTTTLAPGDEPGALFVRVNKGGHIRIARLTPHAVHVAVQKRAKQASLKAFSPHDLRRSFVSDLIDAGADIVTVQHLAGHANVTTTARYDRRGEAAKRKAAELLHVPV